MLSSSFSWSSSNLLLRETHTSILREKLLADRALVLLLLLQRSTGDLQVVPGLLQCGLDGRSLELSLEPHGVLRASDESVRGAHTNL